MPDNVAIKDLMGVKPPAKRRLKYAPSNMLVLPEGLVGLEVEIENASERMQREIMDSPWFDVKGDGSLRGMSCEAVYKEPLFGEDLLDSLIFLETTLTNYASSVAKKAPDEWFFSPRCSVHIHLDCTELTQEEVVSLGCIYSIIERPLFDSIPDRKHNNFCVPWYVTREPLLLLSRLIRDAPEDRMDKVERFRRASKYSALNMSALAKFGTVEFRHLAGTCSYETLLTWVNFALALRKIAQTGFELKDFVSRISEPFAAQYVTELFDEAGDTMVSGKLSLDNQTLLNDARRIQLLAAKEGPRFKEELELLTPLTEKAHITRALSRNFPHANWKKILEFARAHEPKPRRNSANAAQF